MKNQEYVLSLSYGKDSLIKKGRYKNESISSL